MKECPICHSKYDDSLNFCTNDGHQLSNVDTSQSSTNLDRNNVNAKADTKKSPPKQNKGCFKKILIIAVVVVVVIFTLYNHMVNAATYLRTEPAAVQVTKRGGSCKIEIDYDGYIWVVNHKPDWVAVYENENDFEISVNPNRTGQVREGSITIQSGKQLAQVVIRQNAYAAVMKVSETSLKFSRSGGAEDISIETDGCEWSAEYTNWMTVTKESDSELHIKCPSNSGEYRTGTIIVKEDNVCVTISVSQTGDCNNCHGSGEISCGSCMGMGGMGYGMFYSNCMWCGGKGKTTCGTCGGSGVRE